MANSINDAARDGYLDLLEKLNDEAIQEKYSDEVATTLSDIADIYESMLTEEARAELRYDGPVHNNMADQLRRLIFVVNALVVNGSGSSNVPDAPVIPTT